MVATDGRRLAISAYAIDADGAAESSSAIVPTKGLQLFCRVVSDPLDQVKLSVTDGQVGLKSESTKPPPRLAAWARRWRWAAPEPPPPPNLAGAESWARRRRPPELPPPPPPNLAGAE